MTTIRRVRATLVVLAVAGPLAACAGSGSTDATRRLDLPERFSAWFRADVPEHRTVVPAPIDRVEALVPGVYEHLGLPVERATGTRERVFITPGLRIRGQLYEGERNSDYIDCGEAGPGGDRADLYEVEFNILTWLREGGPGATIVETLLAGEARRPGVSSGVAVRCTGTGKLERQIAELLRERVGGGG